MNTQAAQEPTVEVLVVPTPITPEILARTRRGDKLSDSELVGAYAHFAKLGTMLSDLGPTWHIALDAAWRESVRLRDYVAARGLMASATEAIKNV